MVAEGGAEELGGGLGVVALDGEDDEVELGVGFFREFDGVDVVDVAGSGFADHAEAVVAEGLEVGTAGDEGDVMAGLEETGADEAADAAGAHDEDLHGDFISLGGFEGSLWLVGWEDSCSDGRLLRNPRVVARKTPHRFRPKTPEPASPLGEGEERIRPG